MQGDISGKIGQQKERAFVPVPSHSSMGWWGEAVCSLLVRFRGFCLGPCKYFSQVSRGKGATFGFLGVWVVSFWELIRDKYCARFCGGWNPELV